MAIETTKNSLCINQIMEQKNESFVVEGDSIIPDIKPDILNTISTSGTVCIYKKEILEGKVRIDGCINTYIMYLADDEGSSVRAINHNLDFTQVIDLERARPDMQLETNISLRSIECKVLNGRKVSIKGVVDIGIKLSSNDNVEIIEQVNNMNNVQTLNKEFQINTLIGSGTTKVYAKDTITIDNIDNLVEVMKADLHITNKDTKISYNKVLIKSDLNVKLLYLTEDNRMNTVEATIPVMGFIDVPDVSEENMCDVRYEIKNLIIKPNSVEEHSIYVEVEIEAHCQVYKNEKINIIQDMYSPTENLVCTQRQVKVMQTKEIIQSVCNIREKQMISELQGNKIYDVSVCPSIQKQNVLNDRILYEGEVVLTFLFGANNSSGVDTKKVTIPFNFNMDFNGVNSSSNVTSNIEIGLQDFVVMSDESVDIKIDLNFIVSVSRNAEINIIDDIKLDEKRSDNHYSMVIYFVKPGDTLWKIAKKFGSTVDDIARVNGIELIDKLNVAEQLFIPRYHE